MAYNQPKQPKNMKAKLSEHGLNELNDYQLTNFSRVDFYPDEYDKIIHQKGVRVIWEKSILCSCISENTGQPDYTCPFCLGKGFQYFDPLDIRVAVTSINRNDSQQTVGYTDVGTAMVTSKSTDNVNFRDRLTFIDFTTNYSQVITVENQRAKLKYDVNEVTMVLNGDIEYKLDEHYTLNESQTEILFSDNVIEDDERVSVLMEVRPAYIVVDMPHELRGTFVKFQHKEETWYKLPKQLQIKREDLLPLKRGDLY